jgi:hypothetical protein
MHRMRPINGNPLAGSLAENPREASATRGMTVPNHS